MNSHHYLSVEDASRLAVTATIADLGHWACSVAVDEQIPLADLFAVLELLRAASLPERQPSAALAELSAS